MYFKLILMIKHIVFFKLSKSVQPADRKMQLKRLEEIFSSLADKFPFIIEYRTGINFNETSNAWDFAIDSVFKNKKDLIKYQDSDEHQEAIRRGSEIQKTKAVIDYEF